MSVFECSLYFNFLRNAFCSILLPSLFVVGFAILPIEQSKALKDPSRGVVGGQTPLHPPTPPVLLPVGSAVLMNALEC